MKKLFILNLLNHSLAWISGVGALGIIGLSLFISGCTGPIGTSGSIGPPGGGDIASVNVTTFQIANNQWQSSGVGPGNYFYFQTTFDSISDPKNIIVEVYFNDSVGNQTNVYWTPLPYSKLDLFRTKTNVIDSTKSNDTVDELSYNWEQGSIMITYRFLNIATCIQPKRTVFLYATAIPVAVIKQHPGINWNDPKSVLSIPEVQAALKNAKK